MSKRVLIVVDRLDFGGAPRAILETATALHAAGVKVILAVLGKRIDYAIPEGLTVETIGLDYQWRRFMWWQKAPNLTDWFHDIEARHGRMDAIVLAWWNTFPIAPSFPSERTWLWAHMDLGQWIGGASHTAWRMAGRSTPKILRNMPRHGYFPLRPQVFEGRQMMFVSDGIRRSFAQDFGDILARAEWVPNPVNGEAIRKQSLEARPSGIWERTETSLAYVGRLSPEKQLDHLLRAFRTSEIPGMLGLIGDGPERNAIERMTRRLGLQDRVWISGFMRNPFPLLRRCKMTGLCSCTESFGMSIAESIVLQIPVVSYRTPYGPEELMTGDLATGLVPCQDENALACAIARIYHEPPAIPAHAMDHLSPERVAEMMLNCVAP